MASYSLSKKALGDLSAIWEYTVDTWSERQADKYYYMLLTACQELADGKVSGISYPDVQAGIAGFRTGQHILFYRKKGSGNIEIVRMLHAQMDLKSNFGQ